MKVTPALMLDVEDRLSKALDSILRTGTAVIVTRNGEYYGIIDDRNIPPRVADPAQMKCSSVSVRAPALSPESPLYESIQAFMNGHFKSIPIVDARNKPMGITTRVDLLEDILSLRVLPIQPVSSLMQGPVYSIDRTKTVGEAQGLMKKRDSHHVLVTENGKARGILSVFDLAAMATRPKTKRGKTVIPQVRSIHEKPIHDILREELTVIKATDDLSLAVEKMVAERHSSILVTSGGKYVGVLAASDIFKAVLEQVRDELPVQISGLGEEERMFIPFIRETLLEVIGKFSKSFTLENIHVYFKKGKSTYMGKLFLEVNRHPLAIGAEEYDLKTAVNELAEELYTLLHKQKDKYKQRKRKKGGWEE